MNMTKDRVELLLIDSTLSKTRFAALAGIDPANFAKKLKGLLAFTVKDLEKISLYTGANYQWLLTGEGDMGGPLNYEEKKTKANIEPGIPFYNIDFMGGFLDAYNDTTIVESYISVPGYNNASCWCSVSGNSMSPKIDSGDMIALKQINDWQNYVNFGEIYGIVTKNELRTIKIIRKGSDDKHFRLVPINVEEYDEQEIDKENILYVFKVVGVIKKF